nr:MAG: hypothetical protein [Bacteriophage sp.]
MAGFYIVDLSLPSDEMVLGLINNDNDLELRMDEVNLGEAEVNTDVIRHPRDTTMLITNGKYARDTLRVYYDRLNIEEVISMKYPIIVRGVEDGNVSDLLTYVNSEYGLGLVPADIVDAALTDLTEEIASTELDMQSTNRAWLGSVPILILGDGMTVLRQEDDDSIMLLFDDDTYIAVGSPAFAIENMVTLAEGQSVLVSQAVNPITATDGTYYLLRSAT